MTSPDEAQSSVRSPRQTSMAMVTQTTRYGRYARDGAISSSAMATAVSRPQRISHSAASMATLQPPTSTTTTKPTIPMSLSASSRSHGRTDLQWQAASEDETAFEICRRVGGGNWTLLASLLAGAESYSDSAATGNSDTAFHHYSVRSCNTSVGSSRNTPVGVPFRPKKLEELWNSAARLTWDDNRSNERSFDAGAGTATARWLRLGRC